MTPSTVSSITYLRCFQYKVLNNALFLNKNFLSLRNQTSHYVLFVKKIKLCSIFLLFKRQKCLESTKFLSCRVFDASTTNTAVLGFSKKDNTESVILYNDLFLILKLQFYRSREKGLLNVMSLVNQIMKIKKI